MNIKEGDKLTGRGLNLTCVDVQCLTPAGSVAGDEWVYEFDGAGGKVVFCDYEIADILADGGDVVAWRAFK